MKNLQPIAQNSRLPLDSILSPLVKPGSNSNIMITTNSIPNDAVERAWINLKDDSMSSDSGPSIPAGSLILIKRLPLNAFDIPQKSPIVLVGNSSGKFFCFSTTMTYLDMANGRIMCQPWNQSFPSGWVNLANIEEAFQIEQSSFNGEIQYWT